MTDITRESVYQVVVEGRVQAAHPITDLSVVTIYRDARGEWWVRPVHEFNDGRFVELAKEGGHG